MSIAAQFRTSISDMLTGKSSVSDRPRMALTRIGALLFLVTAILSAGQVSAQPTGIEYFNDYRVQPEYSQFSAPMAPGVDAEGRLSLTIPLMDIPGRGGLGYSVALSYRSGIQVRQPAGWIGLGWSFNPGAISRQVVAGDYLNRSPNQSSGNLLTSGVDVFDGVANRLVDSYSLSAQGLGSEEFVQVASGGIARAMGLPGSGQLLSQAGQFETTSYTGYKIEAASPQVITVGGDSTKQCDGTNACLPKVDIPHFVVTSTDGTRYVFASPLLSHLDIPYQNGLLTRQYHVATWRITAILAPTFTNPIPSSITANWPDSNHDGGWVRFDYSTVTSASGGGSNYFADDLTQTSYLSGIATPTHYANFSLESSWNPFDQPWEVTAGIRKRLTGGSLSVTGGGTVQSFSLDNIASFEPSKNGRKRLKLNSITLNPGSGEAPPGGMLSSTSQWLSFQAAQT